VIQYNTPEEYRAASTLTLCYTNKQILPLCGVPLLDALLSITGQDACWFIAGALPKAKRVEWAEACARRAKEYAANAAANSAYYAASDASDAASDASDAASDASDAASDASDAASDAAYYAVAAYYAYYAAAYASDAAYYASARKAEGAISVRHGVMLLEQTKESK
jgi:hypothetical protein